ncbi:MAG TPA: hypothetical protein VEF72_00115 [Mycobacterium sp.]|jgi:NAD(P)H dehydrogenase (quinone)|nr:hypothetical protein [Mycobacterium sp.]
MTSLVFSDARHVLVATAGEAKVVAAIPRNPDPHDRQICLLFGAAELN